MRQKRLIAGAAVALTVALAASCTGSHHSASAEPWKLRETPAIQVPESVRTAVDAPPVNGQPKIIGLATVAGADIALVIRGNTCGADLLAHSATGESSNTARTGIGSQRPTDNGPQPRTGFPGAIFSGAYSQAHGLASPYFDYLDVGCAGDAMVIRLEGVPATATVDLHGASVQSWRADNYLFIGVGSPADLKH
ncbi:hypothetical protein [Kitasatospora sp. MAA4]|uniref:hypothetical protein n=1 Tax=Kitasatospora sp. MAA4 TaxID=3035093 RepID=UPI002474B747|nr:hypothetical protein [Kitasatospora sp. MAA4]